MNRFFSFFLSSLALAIGISEFLFITTYAPLIPSRANTFTFISFWLLNFAGILLIASILFFQKWIYEKRKYILLSLTMLLVGFVFIEIFLQIIYNKPLRFSPHPYLNYIGTPNYKSTDGLNMHNSLGMRGSEIQIPKPENRIRIAILGGSTAYEETVRDWKRDFARELQKELKKIYPKKDIEVINAGLPGWDSWEDLVNLEFRLLNLGLDLIIPYEGVNDVHARFVTPSEYRSDNTGNKAQWKRTPCFLLLCLKTVQLLTGFEPYNFDIGAPSYVHPVTNDYNPILGMRPTEALEKNPPIFFERNLKNIIAISKENNIHVLLSTWAWSNKFPNDYYSASIHYQQGFKDLNRVVKKVGKEKNIAVFDFASKMPMDKKYWTEGIHNNEEGVRLKAKLFAKYIQQHHLLDFKK